MTNGVGGFGWWRTFPGYHTQYQQYVDKDHFQGSENGGTVLRRARIHRSLIRKEDAGQIQVTVRIQLIDKRNNDL